MSFEDALGIEQGLLYLRGRTALASILAGLGVSKGDGVIAQAFTCSAVPEAILGLGARPQWVDVEQDSVVISPRALGERIDRTTRAIIVQHTFGIPADMSEVLRVAGEHGLPVIEDCCHTFRSSFKGAAVGSFGVGAFYSFEWGKPVPAGIGGGVRINDERLRLRMRESYARLRAPGPVTDVQLTLQYWAFRLLSSPRLYWSARRMFHLLSRLGLARGNYNELSTDMRNADLEHTMAASVRRRLPRLVARMPTQGRADLVGTYREVLVGSTAVEPTIPDGGAPVYLRFPILVTAKDKLLEEARRRRLEIGNWYATPIHPLSGHALEAVGYETGSCSRAEAVCDRVVTLPVSENVSRRYIAAVQKLLGEY